MAAPPPEGAGAGAGAGAGCGADWGAGCGAAAWESELPALELPGEPESEPPEPEPPELEPPEPPELCFEPERPSAAAPAGGGSAGATEDELALVAVRGGTNADRDFAPSDLPGTSAEASPASAAVSAAAPASIHRRVREIRASAASRCSAAELGLLLVSRAIARILAKDNQHSVRAK